MKPDRKPAGYTNSNEKSLLLPRAAGFAWVPVFGIGLFILLYFIAAYIYPGGHEHDKTTKGFSWLHNYWCELMAPRAQNGQANTARVTALIAMGVLAISLCFFWYTASFLFRKRSAGRMIIRYAGIFSMLAWAFFPVSDHDAVINISGAMGVTAMTFVLAGLFKQKQRLLFSMGIACLLLCLLNNYIYYTKDFPYTLPIIQKISFLFFLGWFVATTIYIRWAGSLIKQ